MWLLLNEEKNNSEIKGIYSNSKGYLYIKVITVAEKDK